MRPIAAKWQVAISAGSVQALQSALVLQLFGAYAVLLDEEYGWSKTVFAIAFSLNRAESGILGPLQGWALERYGVRSVMRAGIVILVGGFVVLSQVTAAYQYLLAFALISVGAGLSGFLSVTTSTVRWFVGQQARAMSVLVIGMAAGGMVAPILVWLMELIGWRTFSILSTLGFVIVWPLAGVLDRKPDDQHAHNTGDDLRRSSTFTPPTQFSASAALRTRAFWLIAIGHASALLVVGATLAHLALYLTSERGMSLQQASIIATLIPICQCIGAYVSGEFGDRVEKRLLAAFAMCGHAIALAILAFAENVAMILAFVVLHGLAWGVRGPLMQAIRADYFGSAHFSQIMGYSSVVLMIGAVGGPLLAGTLADATGTYRNGFVLLAALAGLGTFCFVASTPPDASQSGSTGHSGQVAARLSRFASRNRRTPAPKII